jgi:hypothetical protein
MKNKKTILVTISLGLLLLSGCGVTQKATNGNIKDFKETYYPLTINQTFTIDQITYTDGTTANITPSNVPTCTINAGTIRIVSLNFTTNYPEKIIWADAELQSLQTNPVSGELEWIQENWYSSSHDGDSYYHSVFIFSKCLAIYDSNGLTLSPGLYRFVLYTTYSNEPYGPESKNNYILYLNVI